MIKPPLVALAIATATALALGACRQAQVQEIADAARPQRLVFRSPAGNPTRVDIRVTGHLDGAAALTSLELPDPQRTTWPASVISGDVDCRIRQAWSAQTCTLEYSPTNVRSGRLSIRLSWH
jgi:hypothetical protein